MKFKALTLAAAAALSFASAAQAAVTYTFTGDYTSARDQDGNPIQTDVATWTFTSASFITSATDLTPSSCTTNNPNFLCSATQRAEPYPNGFGLGALGDYLGLNLEEPLANSSGTGFYFFQIGALGQSGTYSTIDPGGGVGNAGRATLVVSGAPSSAVPEPAAWVMMILGFGLVGSTLRRRVATRVSALA